MSDAIDRVPEGAIAMELAARVLRTEINYAAARPDLALAERDLRRALALAERVSSAWQQVHIEADLAVIEAELGRLDDAVGRLDKLAGRTAALRMHAQRRLLLQNLAAFLLRRGSAAKAEAAARTAADLAAAAGDPVLRASALSLRAEALRRTGDLPAALLAADEAERVQRERDDRWRALTLLRRAQILDWLGRPDDALDDARRAREAAARHGEEDLALAAQLWETMCLVRRGALPRAALAQVVELAESSGVALRPLTRELVARAKEEAAGEGTAP